jgi:ketosteroid isomerase-like protein
MTILEYEPMPEIERIHAFIGIVEKGDYVAAIEQYYTADATMTENMGRPRGGRDQLIRHEQAMLAAHNTIRAKCLEPPLATGDMVAIRWQFHFDEHDGSSKLLEEIAWQRWEGDRIAEERFFYDPNQLATLTNHTTSPP